MRPGGIFSMLLVAFAPPALGARMLKKQRTRATLEAASAKQQQQQQQEQHTTPFALLDLARAVDAADITAASAIQFSGHHEAAHEEEKAAAALAEEGEEVEKASDEPLPAAAEAAAAAGAAVIAAAPVAAAIPLPADASAADATAAAGRGCGDFVPLSRGTLYSFLPWVKECKCGRDEVLYGTGVACDPYASMGFNAEAIFEKNGKDASACACTKQSEAPDTHRVRSDLTALSLLQAETPTIG